MKKTVRFFLRSPCLLIFLGLLNFFLLISKAEAGGCDTSIQPLPPECGNQSLPSNPMPEGNQPLPNNQTPESNQPLPNNQTPESKVIPLSFNWDKWLPPYWLNKTVCREKDGNLICLKSQMARQIGWKIP